jgi:hypothetical protein
MEEVEGIFLRRVGFRQISAHCALTRDGRFRFTFDTRQTFYQMNSSKNSLLAIQYWISLEIQPSHRSLRSTPSKFYSEKHKTPNQKQRNDGSIDDG